MTQNEMSKKPVPMIQPPPIKQRNCLKCGKVFYSAEKRICERCTEENQKEGRVIGARGRVLRRGIVVN